MSESLTRDFVHLKTELLDSLTSVDNIQTSLRELSDEVHGQSFLHLLQQAAEAFFNGQWNACQRLCKTLLDITWEHLNTGNWKDVPVSWRHAYTITTFFLALAEFAMRKERDSLSDVIRTCDMGLLMGAPLMDNVLARMADKLQQIHSSLLPICQVQQSNHGDSIRRSKLDLSYNTAGILCGDDVPTVCCPSLEHFFKQYMLTGRPVILQNCMDHWPAMGQRRWSIDYLRNVAGCRLVPVELGSQYTDDAWSQTLMTVSEFIDQYIAPSQNVSAVADGDRRNIGYLAQHQLFNQIPRLRRDIVVPDYCALHVNADHGDDDDNVDINAWFGPFGTVSPLHRDAKHNFLAQVVGRKYLRLYEREVTPRVYPFSSPLLETTSQVDVENPDLARFPLFEGLNFKDCILNEGDMLYLPPLYWHFVRSLSVSFSVSFWWD